MPIIGEVGKVHDVEIKRVMRGEDEVTLVKALFIRPQDMQGRNIAKSFLKSIEFCDYKAAERLRDDDRIVILYADEGSYEFEKNGIRKFRYMWRVKKFAWCEWTNKPEEKEAV